MNFVKRLYSCLLKFLITFFGIDFTKKFDAKLRFNRDLNLKKPKTLADKVSYLSLHEITPLMSECADKWTVREYVKKKGIEDILIPTVGGSWSNVSDIEFDKLPDKFIFKATHGCKMNYVVLDKKTLNKQKCLDTLDSWLNTDYGSYSLEFHYLTIPHRIYAEKLLEAPNGLIDYKFHCCNGTPKFVLVCSDRKNIDGNMSLTRHLFDMKWNPINEIYPESDRSSDLNFPKPALFDRMCDISKILSNDFKFVRVDLYCLNDHIYFGELSFTPACSVFSHFSDSFVEKMGEELRI